MLGLSRPISLLELISQRAMSGPVQDPLTNEVFMTSEMDPIHMNKPYPLLEKRCLLLTTII